MQPNRRTFLQALAAASAAGSFSRARAQSGTPEILIGICAGPNQAAKLKAIGYDYLEGGVAGTLKPEMTDAAFAQEAAMIRSCVLPTRSCNGFIPASFRLTGPEPTHAAALNYAVNACRHADAAGIPYIVLGSGTARRMPEGFDPARGKAQFIEFCQSLGDRIADLKVTIVLEPLNKGETNLLNSVTEGIEYVEAIQRPRIRLLADVYHMLKEGESPDSIRQAGARLLHCHIAELEGRMAPGTKGEDLSGFFKALKGIGYAGGVTCECGWPKEHVEAAWKKALLTLRQLT